jgi:hypothetical protein
MGNNLLHTICYNGHAHILPWLTGRFGSDLADGLNDENRNEITPPMAAIKVIAQYHSNLNFLKVPILKVPIHNKICKEVLENPLYL